jgi:hypothetical protein
LDIVLRMDVSLDLVAGGFLKSISIISGFEAIRE